MQVDFGGCRSDIELWGGGIDGAGGNMGDGHSGEKGSYALGAAEEFAVHLAFGRAHSGGDVLPLEHTCENGSGALGAHPETRAGLRDHLPEQ